MFGLQVEKAVSKPQARANIERLIGNKIVHCRGFILG
jgi:hypothetical protein